jgi:DNA mismatch repair protein MutS
MSTNLQEDIVELKAETPITPMMVQWHACKKVAPNAVLFFRMGDFYEAFYEDAALLAKELDLTLTKRQDIPMSGIPHHTAEGYIDKLVQKGFRVAVAEQTEDPREAKGLVKREVVRVVTPGSSTSSTLLSEKSNNFFASINQIGSLYGLSFIDLSTSEFYVIELESELELLNEICRISPSEILTSKKFLDKHGSFFNDIKKINDCLITEIPDWHFEIQVTYNFLVSHFKVHNLDGFGLRGLNSAVNAAGALLQYLKDSLCLPIDHINQIITFNTSEFMTLDRITERNLELTASLMNGGRKNSLLNVLDHTETPMGARLMRQLIKKPLLSVEHIQKRQDAIASFLNNPNLMERLKNLLTHVKDLERLMMKVSTGLATPRDLVALKCSFDPIFNIKTLLTNSLQTSVLINEEREKLDHLPDMTSLIAKALVDEPPARISDGGSFRAGFHEELDELLLLSQDSKSWVANYQVRLKEETGIKTLKVGFTKMFGYYIEVSKGQADRMPDSFQRRQTLVNAERYITPELKNFESRILSAEERILKIEQDLFSELRRQVALYAPKVQQIAKSLALIDCLYGLAKTAEINDYRRPIVDNSSLLEIIDGRHPVIETSNISQKFVPNDTLLGDENNHLLVITGPNMAGKSTYIRQVALIAIMAQIGSFIPAKSAHIGIIDKVFTRIGASDDLSRGQSTFMVEMTESANILNNATSKSLVILDEIGRGTSTYDGISIAWSVAEYLLTSEKARAKTLFATHYFELTKMEEKIHGAVNYHVAVNESPEGIIFLHKIVRGGTDKSYGIHVGRLAGLPLPVITRAKEILAHLEENSNRKDLFEPPVLKKMQSTKPKSLLNENQLKFF